MKKLKTKFLSILPVIPVVFCSGCNTHTKSNIEDYFDILQECKNKSDFHTQLYIFPETIEGTEIVKFFYQETSDLFTGSYFFYLVLTYSQEGFDTELQRMSEVKSVFKNGAEKTVIEYPEDSAFLTIKRDNRYEYALYNKETLEIAYISNQLYQWKDLEILEERHTMPDFTIPADKDNGKNTYNMYYLYQDNVGYEVTDDIKK